MSSSPPVQPQSGTNTNTSAVASEAPLTDNEGEPQPMFPPYPPYVKNPPPASVADTINVGRDIRVKQKTQPRRQVHPMPKPARPRGPKATDVKMDSRESRAHARCMRRHGAIITDRLERMAKPPLRTIIYMWREHADTLPAETIARFKSYLDADEPGCKPTQAIDYFLHLHKAKKRTEKSRGGAGVNQMKKDLLKVCADKRFVWARNATVAFARGIQRRLTKPGRYALADSMLRLSNIILGEMCGFMNLRVPARCCNHPKARFMMEMADKVAVWIDEIITESDERMLMMDFDEDDEVLGAENEDDADFADSFLDMMGGKKGEGDGGDPNAAYKRFKGPMLEAFNILTECMTKKGNEELLHHGKFAQSYKDGATELRTTSDFTAKDYSASLCNELQEKLADTARNSTPEHLAPHMNEIVDICSKYLAQHAERNKMKGPAFHLLVKTMKTKPTEQLYKKEHIVRNYGEAAKELEDSKSLETNRDDPALTKNIHASLRATVASVVPKELKSDMAETLDICSKYLSQNAVDAIERGPAFEFLIKELESDGGADFTPQFTPLSSKYAAAHVLKEAPGLTVENPDQSTVHIFNEQLHRSVDLHTPANLKPDMPGVIDRCAGYLSAFARDRGKVLEILLKMMNGKPKKELCRRNTYSMSYGDGAHELENAPMIVPFVPVKDIADEIKRKLTPDVEPVTPPPLKLAMKSMVEDAAGHLSQEVALKSGAAGEKYALNLLSAIKKSLGIRPLYKYKQYGQTYTDAADVLKHAGPLRHDPNADHLRHEIMTEMHKGVPTRMSPNMTTGLHGTMDDAAKHLAVVGLEKGDALDHLVGLMKEKGDEKMAFLQGHDQSYLTGGRRIEDTPTLTNKKVDEPGYKDVHGKLTTLANASPEQKYAEIMPEIVDESSKFLASSLESEAEKRKLLAELMAREGDKTLHQAEITMSYEEGAKEVVHAPPGKTTAECMKTKGEILGKVNDVIPTKELQTILETAANEGSAHLADVVRGVPTGAWGSGGRPGGGGPGGKGGLSEAELEEERRRREAEALRLAEEERLRAEAERLKAEEERLRAELAAKAAAGGAGERRKGDFTDFANMGATKVLIKQLRGHGNEVLYKQPLTTMTHLDAAQTLINPVEVDKSVKESPETLRLAKKFEKKLSNLVKNVTPDNLKDEMQDVIVEASQKLSESFTTANNKAMVRSALIGAMQKQGNEILVEVDGAAETFFFAAQRLKRGFEITPSQPYNQVAYYLTKKLEEAVRCRPIPRRITGYMKDHVKNAADFLAGLVTKPDEHIEAYIALLEEMEAGGDSLLVNCYDIVKSNKDAAGYLRQLTTFEDMINRPNMLLQFEVERSMHSIMANIRSNAYSPSVMSAVISESARLLVSFIMLEAARTENLKIIVSKLDEAGEGVLLRHGPIRKSYKDGADLLRHKTTDQLSVDNVDPVAQRKIQIKLNNLMQDYMNSMFYPLMEDVVEDCNSFLAYSLLQPQIIRVCKCMKNVFVQCELWCEEMLRRVGRPCCSCARSHSARALDLPPSLFDPTTHGSIQVNLTDCPARPSELSRLPDKRSASQYTCRAPNPTFGCRKATTSYLMYSAEYDFFRQKNSSEQIASTSRSVSSTLESMLTFSQSASPRSCNRYGLNTVYEAVPTRLRANADESSAFPSSSGATPFNQKPTVMFSSIEVDAPSRAVAESLPEISRNTASDTFAVTSAPIMINENNEYTSRAPIVTTDQMSDWHAMMVSLMWNMQAWRDWIQDNVDTARRWTLGDSGQNWVKYERRVTTEAIKWRRYNTFSKELALRLAHRYQGKRIVSPTRATIKTEVYREYQLDMLNIISMFSKWTHWLMVVVKETNSKTSPTSGLSLHEVRWNQFQKKVEECSEDWKNYNTFLELNFENKYKNIISEWLPLSGGTATGSAVWVVSACGAVPSGAAPAGKLDGEVLWVARTAHRDRVLPGALQPSKHCCIVYADGEVHHYTKYQVLCNASVSWVSWRAGRPCAGAVRAASGVCIGRVKRGARIFVGAVTSPRWLCSVTLNGRTKAYMRYEILVLPQN